MSETSISRSVHIRLALTMTFWGGTFVAGRILAENLSPLAASSLRFILASTMLLLAILIRDKSLPGLTWKQWGAMGLLGLTGVFSYNIFFFTGLQTVEAGRASMIIAVNPVVTTLLAIFFFGERCNLQRSIGMIFSVSGAMVVISRGNPVALLQGNSGGIGEFYILGCVLSWSAYTLIGKRLLKDVEPLIAVAYSCSIGAVFLTVAALNNGQWIEVNEITAISAGCLFYFAFFGTTLGFIWFYDGVKKLGAARAAMYVNLVPVSGIILGILILGEQLSTSLFIGSGFVFTGLFLINRRSSVS
jgi:drug/metabolite transporter (DMT)-like permease